VKLKAGFCLGFIFLLAGCTRDLSATGPIQPYPTYTPFPTYTPYPSYTPPSSGQVQQGVNPDQGSVTLLDVMGLIETSCDPESRNWSADQAYTQFRGVVPSDWAASRWSVINTDEYNGSQTCWYATYRPSGGEIDYVFFNAQQQAVIRRYHVQYDPQP
jgi:hypothetical protein